MKKISVILISFNRGYEIEKTIKSIVDQNYDSLEFIIIDGGSTDNTLIILEKYKNDISILVSEPDTGIYNALNKGIKLATGEIISFCTTGTVMLPNTLNMVNSTFNDSFDVLYGNVIIKNPNDIKTQVIYPYPLKDLLIVGSVFNTESAFYSGEIFKKGVSFTEKYKIAGDFELNLKLYLEGIKFKYINREISIFETGGISSDGKSTTKENIAILKEYRCDTKKVYKNYYSYYITDFLKSIHCYEFFRKVYHFIK